MNNEVEANLRIEPEGDGMVMYLVVGGKRIAKRYPRKNWICIEPGYTVRGGERSDYDTITVEYDANVRPH